MKKSKTLHFPESITLETNPNTCNLNCKICDLHSPLNSEIVASKSTEQMPKQVLTKILDEALENNLVQITPSTMGEPLMYEHFDVLHDYCKKGNIKMNITTNGTFPGKSTDDWGKMLCEICSDIKVSMLGPDEETLKENMSGVSYTFLINNLKTLLRKRDEHYLRHNQYITITLKVTFMINVLDKLENLVETALNLGIDRVRGHFLLPVHKELLEQDITRNQEMQERWNKVSQNIKQKMEGKKTLSGKRFILDNFDPISSEKADAEKVCPYLGRELVIKANGDAVSCCVPDTIRNSIPIFGNLKNQTVQEIWESEQYKQFQENYLQNPVCKGCELKVGVVY